MYGLFVLLQLFSNVWGGGGNFSVLCLAEVYIFFVDESTSIHSEKSLNKFLFVLYQVGGTVFTKYFDRK